MGIDDRMVLWKQAITIYFACKDLLLRAEELDGKMFFPPIIQFRDALDHIMRVMTVEYGFAANPEAAQMQAGEDKDKYCDGNLDKALGHLYRAFFDIADWHKILLKERISGVISQYDPDHVVRAIPDYYSRIRPTIERMDIEVAQIRERKDIGNKGAISKEVDKYRSALLLLQDDWLKITSAEASLRDMHKAAKKKDRTALWVAIALLILGALVTVAVEKIWK